MRGKSRSRQSHVLTYSQDRLWHTYVLSDTLEAFKSRCSESNSEAGKQLLLKPRVSDLKPVSAFHIVIIDYSSRVYKVFQFRIQSF